jgi:hypothetical protein
MGSPRYRLGNAALTAKEWAKRLGIAANTFLIRVHIWGLERACSEPRGGQYRTVKYLAGERFGALLVLSRAPSTRKYGVTRREWLCRCDCGNERTASTSTLCSGKVVSCGCRSRACKVYTVAGGRGTARELASLAGIAVSTVYQRMVKGKPVLESRRSQPRLVTVHGETLNVSEWAKRVGVSRERMRQRLNKYPVEVAVVTPRGQEPSK